MKITTAYFSATNTTKTVMTALARVLGTEQTNYNLTNHPLQEEVTLTSDDVLVVGMPVYGGRIPSVAAESLRHFKGTHTPLILVAVYGNREFEDALLEMQDLLEANGFIVTSAAAFIAQHSIFPHTAKGRPDYSDFQKIREFGELSKKLLGNTASHARQRISLPGNHPYKIPGKIPLKVQTSSRCTECGACIQVCPVHAIPKDNPHHTNYDLCIHCGRCIWGCSAHARHYGGLLYHVAGAVFGWKNRLRKEPQFFF